MSEKSGLRRRGKQAVGELRVGEEEEGGAWGSYDPTQNDARFGLGFNFF